MGYECMMQLEKSIFILEHVLDQLDKSKIRLEDRYESSIIVVGNLSTFYGETGRITDCMEICEKGIKLCLEGGRAIRLSTFLLNKAEAMNEKAKEATTESKKYLRQAYYLSCLVSDHSATACIDLYYRNNYDPEVIWY